MESGWQLITEKLLNKISSSYAITDRPVAVGAFIVTPVIRGWEKGVEQHNCLLASSTKTCQ